MPVTACFKTQKCSFSEEMFFTISSTNIHSESTCNCSEKAGYVFFSSFHFVHRGVPNQTANRKFPTGALIKNILF